MFNRVTLIGNLGKDPEIKTTNGGKKFARFSIATSERWRDRETGEQKEKTEWHNVVVWGDGLAKVVEQYVKKGSQIFVEGSISYREHTDDAGIKRFYTDIVVQAGSGVIKLLGRNGSARRDDVPPGDDDAPLDYGRRDDRSFDDIPF